LERKLLEGRTGPTAPASRRISLRSTLLSTLLFILLLQHSIFLEIALGSPQQETPGPQILSPRIGFPAFLEQNSSFSVELSRAKEDTSASFSLFNELGSHSLTTSSVKTDKNGKTSFLLKVDRIPAGLYSLRIVGSLSGSDPWTRTEPNSVYIMSAWRFPLRVFWISDVHINTSPVRMQNFRGIVRLANFLRPDLMVVTGDVVDNPREEYYELARQLISTLEMPVILVGGNHDHATEGNYFERHLAPWNGSVDIGPIHITTLDTGSGSIDGTLDEKQLAWLDRDLNEHPGAKYKVIMFHHPMFNANNPRNETVHKIYEICSRRGVNLILNGHMHRDIVFRGPVLTLVNPNGYEGGRPYTGIRILNFTDHGIEWKYAGGEKPLPLYDFKIWASQPNDGSTLGIVVRLANGWITPVHGVLKLRIGHGQELTAQGATVSETIRLEKYLVALFKIRLEPNEHKEISVFSAADKTPPVVRLRGSPLVRRGAMVTIVDVIWEIRDEILGVDKAEAYYSLDNKTWQSIPLEENRPQLFLGSIQVDKAVDRIFFYASAWDVKGLKASAKIESLLLGEEKVPERVSPFPATALAAMFLCLLLIVIVIALRRRSSKLSPNSQSLLSF